LFRELPVLVEKGVLPEPFAERLRQYYESSQQKMGRSLAVVLFSILGSLLISLGVILLLAHNWEDLSRATRTGISLGILLGAQALSGWVLWFRNRSIAWKEGSSLFLTLAIGTSISLVAQTYHLSASEDVFILVWMLASLPLAYLFESVSSGIIYWVGMTSWAGCVNSSGLTNLMFWPLAVLLVPFYFSLVRYNPRSIRSGLLSWVLAVCVLVAYGVTLSEVMNDLWILAYASLFCVFYILGTLLREEEMSSWLRPFHRIGALGLFGLSYLLTYHDFWEHWIWRLRMGMQFEISFIIRCLLIAVLTVMAGLLMVLALRRGMRKILIFGIVPLIAGIGFFLGYGLGPFWPAILFNIYLFSAGIGILITGIQGGRLGVVNQGMLIVIALILTRFFDTNLSFLIRGSIFILTGLGFLAVNGILYRRWRTHS
jgi:uncharacterized membrane protein